MVTSKGLTLATMAREIFTFQWSRNEHFICLNVLWNTLTASKNTFFGQRIKHSLQVLEEDHVIPQRALCYGNFIDINEMYAKLMPLPAQIKPLDSVFMLLENTHHHKLHPTTVLLCLHNFYFGATTCPTA